MGPPVRSVEYLPTYAAIQTTMTSLQAAMNAKPLSERFIGISIHYSSIIQLATTTHAYVLDIRNMRKLPGALVTLLSDSSVVFLGLMAFQEVLSLKTTFKGLSLNVLDLERVLQLTHAQSEVMRGLADLSKGLDLPVNSMDPISPEQITQAGNLAFYVVDAWLSHGPRRNQEEPKRQEPPTLDEDTRRKIVHALELEDSNKELPRRTARLIHSFTGMSKANCGELAPSIIAEYLSRVGETVRPKSEAPPSIRLTLPENPKYTRRTPVHLSDCTGCPRCEIPPADSLPVPPLSPPSPPPADNSPSTPPLNLVAMLGPLVGLLGADEPSSSASNVNRRTIEAVMAMLKPVLSQPPKQV